MLPYVIESGRKVEGFGYLEGIYSEDKFVKCECELCEYWRQAKKHRFRAMILGIFMPLIWVFEIIKHVCYLYTDLVLKQSSRASIYYTNESHMQYHRMARDKLWSWVGYNLIAIVIEVLAVMLLVVAGQPRPTDGTFLVE
ncbi:hypothetical protein I9W82_001694 [Candida metapsilosis]|uniref:Uncharacterized protein n=1 Tax=Candida metapsilosis TaxID=273372 RepID=A0A8H7ZFW2_9ASCO|nr:hypothetical protein I9W82_001694 [Candida metapsilosis]